MIFAASLIMCGCFTVQAKDILVTENLRAAIDSAAAGDRILLSAGTYAGPIELRKPLSLIGGAGVVIKGNGTGNVITVKSSGVRLSGLTITGSGLLLETQDSGIFLGKEATGAMVEDNQVLDNLIGVYIWGAKKAIVQNNIIRGRQDCGLMSGQRGSGLERARCYCRRQ